MGTVWPRSLPTDARRPEELVFYFYAILGKSASRFAWEKRFALFLELLQARRNLSDVLLLLLVDACGCRSAAVVLPFYQKPSTTKKAGFPRPS
jgi:hypothetical protein